MTSSRCVSLDRIGLTKGMSDSQPRVLSVPFRVANKCGYLFSEEDVRAPTHAMIQAFTWATGGIAGTSGSTPRQPTDLPCTAPMIERNKT